MKEQADKLMLLFVFAGLGVMLFLFRDSQNIANGFMLSIAGVVGAVCNMAQGKSHSASAQTNITDSSISIDPKDAKPTT